MSRHLYSITLQKPTSIQNSVVGQFSGDKTQEIVAIRGSYLELFKLDKESGKLNVVLSHNCFAIIRTIAPFRIAGTSQDRLLVTSDSGKMVVLEYQPDKNKFVQLYAEPYGKTGIRRTIPGQYIAVDPKGRACIIASVEKNKLVYVLNRDSEANVTISSPLEAHTPHTLVYSIVALDVGYDNPLFASLEVDYNSKSTEKKLVYYELDLGLNHVIRKWSTVVDRQSNLLIPVLGGSQGPSGVLVGTMDWVYYYQNANHPVLKVPIPRRKGSEGSVYLTYGVMHKIRGEFFFLAQSNLGDLYKINMEYDPHENQVLSIEIKFFQTIPLCNSFNILKLGFLFAAHESGNHEMYQFEDLGDEDDTPVFSSRDKHTEPVYFKTIQTSNIVPVASLSSLDALMGVDVANLTNDDTPQIYTISGQGERSTFRTLKYGLPSNLLTASALPARPLAVWTVKTREEDEFDKYIVLSFANSTIVLEVGSGRVNQVSGTGINESMRTLAIQQLGRDSMLQVHPDGIRHISSSKKEGGGNDKSSVNEWATAAGEYIIHASCNNYQVAIALNTNKVVYFELDDEGHLNEYQERVYVPGGVSCLSVGDIPAGKVRSSFLVIGCNDATIRILSLDLGSTLEPLTVQALTAQPSDVLITHMTAEESQPPVQYLHIGLKNGVYISSILDPISGQLSDTRTRFLGPQELKLFRVKAGEAEKGNATRDAIMALSTKVWLGYTTAASNFDMTPVDIPNLRAATALKSSEVTNGIIGVESTDQGSNMHIFSITDLSDKLRQSEIKLRHTPRRMCRTQRTPRFYYVIETDNNTLDIVEQGFDVRSQGSWASCIEVVDPVQGKIVHRAVIDNNEAAFSITSCIFESNDQNEYLVVGTAQDQVMLPKSCKSGFIRVYKVVGESLEFMYKTQLPEAPLALMPFQGRLMVAVGNSIRLYDVGLKQLLRKYQHDLPSLNTITTLSTDGGDNVVVGDMKNSLTYLVYKHSDGTFWPYADDTIPRHVTCSTMLDSATTMCGDRFGNIFMMSSPEAARQLAEEDVHGVMLRNLKPTLNASASHRLDLESHYHVQDTPVSLCKASLVNGGGEAVVYGGLQGTIGAVIPLATKQDAEFFSTLEQLIRAEDAKATTQDEGSAILGREHLVYRGYYAPVKATIDGDLCERFAAFSAETQRYIATELGDRTIRDVERKIADMRIRSVF